MAGNEVQVQSTGEQSKPFSANLVGAICSAGGLSIALVAVIFAIGMSIQHNADQASLSSAQNPSGSREPIADWLGLAIRGLMAGFVSFVAFLVGSVFSFTGMVVGGVSAMKSRDGHSDFALIAGAIGLALPAFAMWLIAA